MGHSIPSLAEYSGRPIPKRPAKPSGQVGQEKAMAFALLALLGLFLLGAAVGARETSRWTSSHWAIAGLVTLVAATVMRPR